mmetsp:Transcript_1462/g.4449  ORF Transcript_1462/g.4449 Transcript_1462/m.4449 type:complete len:234 (+) Transcript_1462:1096-1797(+)
MAFRIIFTKGKDVSLNSVGSIIFPEYAKPPIPLSATKHVSLLSSTLFPVLVTNFSALKGTSLRKSSTVIFLSTSEMFGVKYRNGNSFGSTPMTRLLLSPLPPPVVVVPVRLSITLTAQSNTILSPSDKNSASSSILRASWLHAIRNSSVSSSSSSSACNATNTDAVARSASIPSDALFFLFVFVPSKPAPFINRTIPRRIFSSSRHQHNVIFANRFNPFTEADLFFCLCTSCS